MKLTVSKQQLVNIPQIVGPSDRSSNCGTPKLMGKWKTTIPCCTTRGKSISSSKFKPVDHQCWTGTKTLVQNRPTSPSLIPEFLHIKLGYLVR